MIILTIRTDKIEAEIGLYKDNTKLDYHVWEAHRQLAETLHIKIKSLLEANSLDWPNVEAVVAYEGPGSFTGLRIGLSVANALAYANSVQIIGATGDDWIEKGITKIFSGQGQKQAMPNYGADAHITTPRK